MLTSLSAFWPRSLADYFYGCGEKCERDSAMMIPLGLSWKAMEEVPRHNYEIDTNLMALILPPAFTTRSCQGSSGVVTGGCYRDDFDGIKRIGPIT